MDAITSATRKFKGGQAALARALGISPQAVNQWINQKRPVPPRLALRIEQLTGVARHDLRPDIFGPAPERGAGSER